MSEKLTGAWLKGLRRLVRQVGLYPTGHPLTMEALLSLRAATDDLVPDGGQVVISAMENAFYRNRTLLPHVSLEYHSFIRELEERGIESMTAIHPVTDQDLLDLSALLANVSADFPADGSILLNERYLTPEDLEASETSELRRSYVSSLDALRGVTGAMRTDGRFEMAPVVTAVEGLFEQSVSQSSASLLLSTVKSHDEYTFYHSVNVCILGLAIGRMIGIDRQHLIPIGVGAVLHDIGKTAVSTSVLNYPGRLDKEQWKEITLHPQEGALAILAAGGPGHEISATVAFEHHARFDGAGYPGIQRVRRPHVYSRLVSVADTYDAITTRRSYRRAETPNHALDALLGGAGDSYDPDLVRTFIDMMGIYPPGSILEIPNGALAVVVSKSSEPGGPLETLLVRDPAGRDIDPEPYALHPEDVTRQLLAQQIDIDPAALLESLEPAHQPG
ncbi:MAG: HD domain-containing protein [Acidimicrobiia bacterium]|nr:HD domain-containing protein [Acidimicrobiia bacterium]